MKKNITQASPSTESTDQLTEIVVTYPVLVLVVDNNTKNNNGMINSGTKTESSQLPANL